MDSSNKPTASAMKRRGSIKRRASGVGQLAPQEVPWDLFERLMMPMICCHAAAVILSTLLNVLRISQVSALPLFTLFSLVAFALAMFYHHLQVAVSGKSVLITGCESPLASCLARRLDDVGFTVFAGFTKLSAHTDDVETLKDESSGRLKVIQLDVTSETQMLEASLFIAQHLPSGAHGLWAVVHCAAWMALGELEWVPFPVLRKSVDINLLGAARLTQIMMPLVRRASGRIVFLSSALARIPAPVRGVQCAVQAGIEGLAACLRQELKPRGVDVCIVAAGEYTNGTTWLTDDAMLDQAKNMWSMLSEEQKETYGEDYFERAIRSLEKYTKTNADLNPAVRTLTDAVVRTFPLARYTPVTRAEKFQTIAADYLPRTIYDRLYHK